jgi:hypothetical protein
VAPLLAGATFIPASRQYVNLTASQSNQDFTLAADVVPLLTITQQGTNAHVAWPTVPGFKYLLKKSEDLAAWQDSLPVIIGTGGVVARDFGLGSAGKQFFRVVVNP